jgi:3-methyladenine DNA glycosylase AlkC
MNRTDAQLEEADGGKGFSLKDQLFNREKVKYLAHLFAAQEPEFAQTRFIARVMKRLSSLELKQRITWIAECLEAHLPSCYPDAVAQILRSLPQPLDETKTDDDFGDFIIAPLGEFIVRRGMAREHLELSLSALKEITKRFSMEDAVRTFVRHYPDESIRELTQWTRDSNYHVRRVVSESTRPLLPWSARITLPIETTLPLLDVLHNDRTRYVTRSVANHLNDIAKSHPELVVETLQRWHACSLQDQDELRWMTHHALRTLVKRGHPGAMRLLGFRPNPMVTVTTVRLAKNQLLPGESLDFSVDITADRAESLVVDYAIEFVKAGGRRTTKVYKATKLSLGKGETRTISKCHKLHANATTYQLYAGEHMLTIQINGQPTQSSRFTLLDGVGTEM